ncbi:MAG: ABC transporter substrate-binding protein [Actinomycetota bacterium]
MLGYRSVKKQDRARPFVAAVAAVALVAAACGDDDATDTTAAATTEAPTESTEPAVGDTVATNPPETTDEADTTASTDDTADTSADDGGDAGDAASATIVITDVVGEQEVPVTDQGIYALDELMGTLLLTLGVEPVTTAAFFQDPLLAPVLLSDRTELVEFGAVESIAATDPDLILGVGHPNFIEIIDSLQGVAPTVLPDFNSSWQDQTMLISEVVGREAEAEALVATLEGRIADLAAEIEQAGLTGTEVSIVQNFGPDWFSYGPSIASSAVLAELGFTRSEAQSSDDNFGFPQLSEEIIPDETSSPFVFGVATTSPDGTVIGTVTDNPIVGGPDSVVTDVSEAWFNNSVLGIWIVLDDIEAVVFGRGEVTQNDGAGAAFADLIAATEANGS